MQSLVDLQYASNIAWYQQWIIPASAKVLAPENAADIHRKMGILNVFGEISFLIKILINLNSIKNYCSLQEDISPTGEITLHYEYDKAMSTTVDLGLTIASGVGYFLLRAAWASPLFIAMSAFNLVSSIFYFYKDLCNYHQCVTQPSLLLENTKGLAKPDEYFEALRLYHQKKLTLSTFQTGMSYLFLICTAMWVAAPIPAVVGFIVLGTISYFVQRNLQKKTAELKQNAIELFSPSGKKQMLTPAANKTAEALPLPQPFSFA